MNRVRLLCRVVNRRPDDECQRERGTYGSVDEGLQVRGIRTQVIAVDGSDCGSLTVIYVFIYFHVKNCKSLHNMR